MSYWLCHSVPLLAFPPKLAIGPVIGLLILVAILSLLELLKIWRISLGVRGWFQKLFENKKLFVYEVFGGRMIKSDVTDMSPQLRYMRSYLKRLFPKGKLSTMRQVYTMDLEETHFFELISWTKRRLDYSQKIQLFDYLIDLAFHNHRFTKREVELLYRLARGTGFPHHEVKAMMRIRYEHVKRAEEARRNAEQRRRHEPSRRVQSEKLTALKVLGLPASTSSIDEVRRAYRQMARVHHPDKFARGNEEEKRLAHERFTEISKSHDLLLKLLN